MAKNMIWFRMYVVTTANIQML